MSVCSKCIKEKPIFAKGLCCACYHRARREKLEQEASEEKEREDFSVSIDFRPMLYLLEEIEKRAAAELRDVGAQILWELNKSIGSQNSES